MYIQYMHLQYYVSKRNLYWLRADSDTNHESLIKKERGHHQSSMSSAFLNMDKQTSFLVSGVDDQWLWPIDVVFILKF